MEPKKRNDEIEIDLRELFMVLLDKWLIIVLAGVVTALAAFGISKFVISPVYQSTTSIYAVNKQETNSVTLSDLQTGTQLTKDYVLQVESRTVLEQVIQEMNLDVTYEGLKGALTVTTPTDTRMLYISVRDKDPYMAMEIANKIREVAAVQISEVMDIDTVNVAEEANLPTAPASPSVKKWTLMGGVLGAFVAVAIVLLMFLINDSIKTPDDIERYLGISTLGSIPINEELADAGKKKKKKKPVVKQVERKMETNARNSNK